MFLAVRSSPTFQTVPFCPWGKLTHDLIEQGWASTPLRAPLSLRGWASGRMTPGVTRDASKDSLRADVIRWIDPTDPHPAVQCWARFLDTAMCELRERLHLSLRSWESHVACYPPGGGYAKHLDSFRANNSRVMSMVTYLNPVWDESWGGQFHAEPLAKPEFTVQPVMGNSVWFRSDTLPHEVLPSSHERWSVATWFRRD